MVFLLENYKMNKSWKFSPRPDERFLKILYIQIVYILLKHMGIESMKHKRNKNLDKDTLKM